LTCNTTIKVTLRGDQWNDPAPDCPRCSAADPMQQEFKAPGIIGGNRARAVALAEDIATNDYGVADMQMQRQEGSTPKVRYKDDTRAKTSGVSGWGGVNPEALEAAIAMGRATRLEHGSALDIIKTMPDYIANSKKLSVKVW
jgi:hypothetical protein